MRTRGTVKCLGPLALASVHSQSLTCSAPSGWAGSIDARQAALLMPVGVSSDFEGEPLRASGGAICSHVRTKRPKWALQGCPQKRKTARTVAGLVARGDGFV
jgi:hypothetical protein